MELEKILPMDIERRSMEIIESEMGDAAELSDTERLVLKRVIHTTADFDYVKNLKFSADAVQRGLAALRNGAVIVTDTHMAESGISKPATKACGCEIKCFMSDADVAQRAKERGVTRAVVSIDKAAEALSGNQVIFAVGNAPTALIRIYELVCGGKIKPALVIGAPVGFVNIIQSKKLIMSCDVPYIVADGRKGGSNVAAAICNAMLYQLYDREKGALIK